MKFGADLAALPDFDGATMRYEYDNLAEALARRLITPRGALWYAPDYGTDLRDYLGEPATDALQYEIERAAVLEIEKDTRVERAAATLTYLGPHEMRLSLSVRTAQGAFSLVLRVDTLTPEMLYGPA